MIIRRIDIPQVPDRSKAFKVVAGSIPVAPLTVLFGPNDAGKSNLLEAIALLLGGDSALAIPGLERRVRDAAHPAGHVVFELEGLHVPGHSDQLLLERLLSHKRGYPTLIFELGVRDQRDHAIASLLRLGDDLDEEKIDFTLAQLVFAPFLPGHPRWFDFSGAQKFEDIMRLLRRELLRYARSRSSDWSRVSHMYRHALGAAMGSRSFEAEIDAGGVRIRWLPPQTEPAKADRKAATELDRLRDAFADSEIPLLDDYVVRLVRGEVASRPFLWLADLAEGSLAKIVQIGNTSDTLDDVVERLETFVANTLEPLAADVDLASQFIGDEDDSSPPVDATGEPYLGDPEQGGGWFEVDEDGGTYVSQLVFWLCECLSRQATRMAPSFLRRRYSIEVLPLPVWTCASGGGRRIAVCLRPTRHGEEAFSLTVAATGMAVWAGYSLLAAADVVLSALASTSEVTGLPARLDEAYGGAGGAAALFPEEALESLSEDDVDEFDEQLREPASRLWNDEPFEDVRPTVFLFDEPERHLHPFVQDDAAVAITEFGRRGITCLLATHALPFFNAPTELSSFIRVTRSADGWTHAVPITHDLVRELDLAADSSEVSRAQLIHLTRAFLVVEGKQDKRVIEHFYGQSLSAARVCIVPLHGSRKAPVLADTEVMRQLDIPIVVLLDDSADERSSASRSIRLMLRYWPERDRQVPFPLVYELPDIICSLPEDVCRRVLGAHGIAFPGWSRLIDLWRERSNTRESFKRFAFKELSIRWSSETFIERILEEAPRNMRTEGALDRTIAAAIAFATPQPADFTAIRTRGEGKDAI